MPVDNSSKLDVGGEEMLFPNNKDKTVEISSETVQKKDKNKRRSKKLKFDHYFSSAENHPFDEIDWEKREAVISNEKGEVIFKQSNVEVPEFWSQLATNVVVSKYFYGKLGTKARETSIKQLMNRVSRSITDWGKKDGYFYSENDAEIYYNELTSLLVNQYASFNSPVWFNVGIEEGDGGAFYTGMISCPMATPSNTTLCTIS